MTLHVLVEGASEVAFFERWATRLFPGHVIAVHRHQGKGRLPKPQERVDATRRGLLCQLPQKLRAFAASLDPATDRVLVLVDADRDDCRALRRDLEEVLRSIAAPPTVLFRVAVEELEAFYLGDLAALRRAFPAHDAELARKFRPDSVCGTAEYFGRVIGDGGLNKVSWAEAMGPRLTTSAPRSRSPSFRALVQGLERLMTFSSPSTRRRRRRRRAKPK